MVQNLKEIVRKSIYAANTLRADRIFEKGNIMIFIELNITEVEF